MTESWGGARWVEHDWVGFCKRLQSRTWNHVTYRNFWRLEQLFAVLETSRDFAFHNNFAFQSNFEQNVGSRTYQARESQRFRRKLQCMRISSVFISENTIKRASFVQVPSYRQARGRMNHVFCCVRFELFIHFANIRFGSEQLFKAKFQATFLDRCH